MARRLIDGKWRAVRLSRAPRTAKKRRGARFVGEDVNAVVARLFPPLPEVATVDPATVDAATVFAEVDAMLAEHARAVNADMASMARAESAVVAQGRIQRGMARLAGLREWRDDTARVDVGYV